MECVVSTFRMIDKICKISSGFRDVGTCTSKGYNGTLQKMCELRNNKWLYDAVCYKRACIITFRKHVDISADSLHN